MIQVRIYAGDYLCKKFWVKNPKKIDFWETMAKRSEAENHIYKIKIIKEVI